MRNKTRYFQFNFDAARRERKFVRKMPLFAKFRDLSILRALTI